MRPRRTLWQRSRNQSETERSHIPDCRFLFARISLQRHHRADAPETLADPIEALEARAKPSGPRPHLLKQHFVYRTACRPMTRQSRCQTSRKSHLTNDLMVTVQLALI